MANMVQFQADLGLYETITMRLDEYAGITISMTMARVTLKSLERACEESGEDIHATLRGLAVSTIEASARQSLNMVSKKAKKCIRSLV